MENLENAMGKGKPIYVGLDVHKRAWVVTVLCQGVDPDRVAGCRTVPKGQPARQLPGTDAKPAFKRNSPKTRHEKSGSSPCVGVVRVRKQHDGFTHSVNRCGSLVLPAHGVARVSSNRPRIGVWSQRFNNRDERRKTALRDFQYRTRNNGAPPRLTRLSREKRGLAGGFSWGRSKVLLFLVSF